MSDDFSNNNVAPQYYEEPQTNGDGGKGMAIASMILGIVSIVLSCIWYVSIIAGVVGIVLAVMYNKKNGRCGMSTAGMVCSIIGMILAVLIIVLAAIGIAAFGGMSALSELQ